MTKQIIYRKLSELKKLPNNPRTISKGDFDKLKASLKDNQDYFEARPLILSDRTGELIILAGNQRYDAAKSIGMNKVPTMLLEGLTEAREREIIIRDNVSNGDWDMDVLANEWDIDSLAEWGVELPKWDDNTTEYKKFVDKFKPKLTTDDCYTPPKVFDAVEKWVRDKFNLNDIENIRPFRPEGDYQKEEYVGKVVIDNPPFSILSEVLRWYVKHDIKFFLFAPHLTLLGSASELDITRVVCCAKITYENGAIVSTSFVTNMADPGIRVMIAGSLVERINEAQVNEESSQEQYCRAKNLKTVCDIWHAAKIGHDWEINKDECVFVNNSDELRRLGKGLYGGGLLVSDSVAEKAAAEKAAAEKAAAEKAAVVVKLSEREKEIVRGLNEKSKK